MISSTGAVCNLVDHGRAYKLPEVEFAWARALPGRGRAHLRRGWPRRPAHRQASQPDQGVRRVELRAEDLTRPRLIAQVDLARRDRSEIGGTSIRGAIVPCGAGCARSSAAPACSIGQRTGRQATGRCGPPARRPRRGGTVHPRPSANFQADPFARREPPPPPGRGLLGDAPCRPMMPISDRPLGKFSDMPRSFRPTCTAASLSTRPRHVVDQVAQGRAALRLGPWPAGCMLGPSAVLGRSIRPGTGWRSCAGGGQSGGRLGRLGAK
jgi:hypothetical protein